MPEPAERPPNAAPGRAAYAYPTYSRSGADRMYLPKALHPYVSRIWLIALLAIVGGGGAAWVAYHLPDTYTSSSTLLVAKQSTRVLSIEGLNQQDRIDDLSGFNTIAQSVSNAVILRRVAVSEKLAQDPRISFRMGTNLNLTDDDAVSILRQMVVVRQRPKTMLIDIIVKSTNGPLTSQLANAVAREYIAERGDQAMKMSETGSGTLMEVVKRLETKLRDSERRLMEFRDKNQISSVQSDLSLLEQLGTKIKTDLVAVRKELETIEINRRLAADAKGRIGELMAITAIAKDPEVTLVGQQIAQQNLILAGYTNRYRDQHPKFVAARQHLASLERSQVLEIERAVLALDRSLPILKASEKSLLEELAKFEARVQELNRLSADYSALEREVATDTALQASVLKRIKELDLTKDVDTGPITVVETASEPDAPSGPNRRILVAMGLFLGICLSVGIIYFLDVSDTSLRNVDEAEERLQNPVLGAVCIDAGMKDHEKDRLVMVDEPNGLTAEAFRSLRANTEMLGKPEAMKVRLVTSAVASEGKSFCALNYASSLAQLGKSVVLVDLDLRRPTVGERLGLDNELPGVSTVFLGQKTVGEVIQPTRVPHLSVIVAGPALPNPAEQLAGSGVGELLEYLTSRFDMVVIDTPPVNAVSDTLTLLPHAQVVLLVVKAGRTPERVARRAISEILRSGSRISGLVLNQLPKGGGGYGYYYSYYGRDAYSGSGVYGAPDKKGKRSSKPKPVEVKAS